MAVELYNDWYISAISSEVGPASGGSTAYQQHNVDKIYSALHSWGWSKNAIAAVLGNMQIESWLNPADATPTIGNTIPAINNIVASHHPDNAYGLVQWKGRGGTDPSNNQLVGYAIRHNADWYDGDIQLERLYWEYSNSQKFHAQTVDGVYYTFNSFVTSTLPVDTLAKAWMVCYEGTYSRLDERKSNSKYWYTYIGGNPPAEAGWISGEEFAALAEAYDPDITGVQIPYSQMDCIQFVQKVWRDIEAVNSTDVLCSPLGTNTLWRMNVSPYGSKTFNTTDPNGDTPTKVLWYKDTLDACIALYGGIPVGALLFHQISEAGPPPIPAQYAGDGIGNFAHVGIYISGGQVMQSGGRDSADIPGGGVHRSNFDYDAWNYVAFVVWVDPTAGEPEPPEPPGPNLPYPVFLSVCYNKMKKKGVVKNVRKWIL